MASDVSWLSLHPSQLLWRMDGAWFQMHLHCNRFFLQDLYPIVSLVDLERLHWNITSLELTCSRLQYLSTFIGDLCCTMEVFHLASRRKLRRETTSLQPKSDLKPWWFLEQDTQEFHKNCKSCLFIWHLTLTDQNQWYEYDLTHQEEHFLVSDHDK